MQFYKRKNISSLIFNLPRHLAAFCKPFMMIWCFSIFLLPPPSPSIYWFVLLIFFFFFSSLFLVYSVPCLDINLTPDKFLLCLDFSSSFLRDIWVKTLKFLSTKWQSFKSFRKKCPHTFEQTDFLTEKMLLKVVLAYLRMHYNKKRWLNTALPLPHVYYGAFCVRQERYFFILPMSLLYSSRYCSLLGYNGWWI